MSAEIFYLVDFCGASCGQPEFISGEFNCDEWEWDEFDPGVESVVVERVYKFKVLDRTIKTLDVDFLGSPHNLVSARFLEVCDSLNVRYRSVPVELKLASGVVSGEYFIFIPLDAVELLDQAGSKFFLEKDLNTSEPVFNRYHPAVPVYSWIRQFSAKSGVCESFFVCIEIMKWVCSEEFKVEAEKKLAGLSFKPIDSEFVFDPWGEMS
ncbi:hypothetical protein [Pseudomonas sp. BF-RE-26]|uniref:hypothetical protein n=1 Tax=Pseudomonas sp. BF-RE-26 TaxID=2832396 RepID=UPI001CBE7AEC|nr:hypothetical protein [Pseudomonas sp. BF-RE-26]